MYIIQKPKKSLGQNFLIDKNIINKIIEVGNINQNKCIIEIGPGNGNLTENIITKKPKKIIAIEKDYKLSFFLKNKFKNLRAVLKKNKFYCGSWSTLLQKWIFLINTLSSPCSIIKCYTYKH